MRVSLRLISAAASLSIALSATLPAAAAAATPAQPAASAQAAHTMRVGGSPADAAFRSAQQKSGVEFRSARAACRNGPAGAERNNCLKAARQRLKEQRLEAQTAHDAAR